MATRSTIALEFADGTIGKVYCHWDGYLDNNGKILMENYSNPFILRNLIDLGDLSSLDTKIGTKCNFDNPVKGQCVFYGRDRGETDTRARYFQNYDEYLSEAQREEYNYILRTDGKWYVEAYDGVYKELDIAMREEALS